MSDQAKPEIDYKALFQKVLDKQKILDEQLTTGLPEEKVRTNDMPKENWASATPKKNTHVWTLEEEKLRVLELNTQVYEDGGDPLAEFRQKYHRGKKDWTLKDHDMIQVNRDNPEMKVVDNRRGIE